MKEDVKLGLFTDDVIVYLENPKDLKNSWNSLSNYSKVAGYKVNRENSIGFLYTNSEQLESD